MIMWLGKGRFDFVKDGSILSFCNKNKVRLPMSWRHSCNAVRYHDRRESFNHWNFKACMAFELMSRGQTIFTELKLANRHEQPVCDLLWLDELIVIEFESEWTVEKARKKLQQFFLFNTFVFDIKRSSLDEMKFKLGLI